MNMIIQFAFKNILRYKRRTTLTFIVLATGIALYIIMIGIFDGFDQATIANFINFETGHFKVYNSTWDEDAPFSVSNFIAKPQDVGKILESKKYVTAWTPRVRFMGEADNGVDSTPCFVTGIDTQRDAKVFSLTNFIATGNFRNPESDSTLIGKDLAKDLGLEVGSLFFLTFRNSKGMMDSIQLTISGILDTPDPLVNSSGIFITMDSAGKFLDTQAVSEISFKVKDYLHYQQYEKDLNSSLKGYKVKNWRDLAQIVLALSGAKKQSIGIMIFFLIIIAVVGIINTMMMSVFEKTKEIGTLKALGMNDGNIMSLFLTEGLIIGLLGGLIGVVVGCLLNWPLVVKGMNLTVMMGKNIDTSSLRMMNVLYSKWNIGSIIESLIMCVGVSVLASWYPARKAVALQAAECLRTL